MSCLHYLFLPWFLLLVALPDQHQPEAGHGGAIAGPLQLVDHEARSRPGDRSRALSDPEQPDDEGKQACYQQKSAHAFLPVGLLLSWLPHKPLQRPRKLMLTVAGFGLD